ncbi:MAG: alpha-ketoglutarate-dependent dioxygenase AlkB [Candidatus Eremiobacteraeota bacterium]|nr:alpha-ketoglutarate-dependent dioxygenase AlkB [Candidatus Eremiobacteraeota bacterium]
MPVAQLDLFGEERRTLVDDATGSIWYIPACIDAATATAWFERLRRDVAWRHERRHMYDRDVDVPRLVAGYRLDEPEVPADARSAARRVGGIVGVAFTNVGLNLYRDGHDSVAPHNDHLYEIVAGFPIALLSLGATRRMTIRSKTRPRRVLDADLENGSLLVMSYETQKHYDHGVPKVKAAVGPRISLAFRVRPA